MKKKFTSILVAFLLFSQGVQVTAIGSLEENKKQYNIVSSEIKEIDNKISNLDDEIYKIKKEITTNENKITQVENEISNTEVKVSSLKEEIEKNEATLSTRLREIYKHGSFSGIDMVVYILKSDGLGDLFSRIHASKTIINFDNKLIDENNRMVDSLNKSLLELQEKRDSINELNNEVRLNLENIQAKQEELSNTKKDLQVKKDKYIAFFKENDENLISKSVDIINSSNPDVDSIRSAINVLESLVPILSTQWGKDKARESISKGNEIIKKLGKPILPPSQPSDDGNYKATYTMEATAYSGHSITALGIVPVRNPNGLSTVAVDDNVIPLGSKVYVPGYGYAIAADTGSAIKGMKIDLYMNSRDECYSFGRRNVTVHLIAYPNEW